jgi:hypothetical protein
MPELEVRDPNLRPLKGTDKDIAVELSESSGTCKAADPSPEEVFPKYKVTWTITNTCKGDRRVVVLFRYPEGSPLKPAVMETTVPGGKQDKIKCEIRHNATVGKKYNYDIAVTDP